MSLIFEQKLVQLTVRKLQFQIELNPVNQIKFNKGDALSFSCAIMLLQWQVCIFTIVKLINIYQ